MASDFDSRLNRFMFSGLAIFGLAVTFMGVEFCVAAIPKTIDQRSSNIGSKEAQRETIGGIRPNRILAGGETKQTLSLLGVAYLSNPEKNSERLKLTWGNAVMEPWLGAPGYFHIEYREAQRDAVVELARTMTSFADLQKMKGQLEASEFVKNVEIEFDRTSQNMLVHIQFKTAVELRAVTGKDAKAGSYLAIDFSGRGNSRGSKLGANSNATTKLHATGINKFGATGANAKAVLKK